MFLLLICLILGQNSDILRRSIGLQMLLIVLLGLHLFRQEILLVEPYYWAICGCLIFGAIQLIWIGDKAAGWIHGVRSRCHQICTRILLHHRWLHKCDSFGVVVKLIGHACTFQEKVWLVYSQFGVFSIFTDHFLKQLLSLFKWTFKFLPLSAT